jgi:hypothetical protein
VAPEDNPEDEGIPELLLGEAEYVLAQTTLAWIESMRRPGSSDSVVGVGPDALYQDARNFVTCDLRNAGGAKGPRRSTR